MDALAVVIGLEAVVTEADLARIEARARAWGRRAGVALGEPLVVQDCLPISDPTALLAGAEG